MASTILKAKCIDIKNKLYMMEYWGDDIDDCVSPYPGMVMCGGSKAIITTGSSVKHYIYDSSTNSWKEDMYGIVSSQY